MIVDVDVHIDRPIVEVFDAMADARNEPKWNSRVSETDLISPEPITQGSQFRTVNRGQPYTATLTELTSPSKIKFLVEGKGMDITSTLNFTEDDAGTRMTGSFDMQPKGFMKVMLPLMTGAVRKDFPRQMTNFKQFCESSSA